MTTYTNTSAERRTWPHLVSPETNRTLALDPGETVDLDVPDGFSDPYLVPQRRPVRDPRPAPDTKATEPAVTAPKE